MKYASAKAKGRRLQQQVAKLILGAFSKYLEAEDVMSTPMGVNGPDIILSPRAKLAFPFAVECKNVEKLDIWSAIDQAEGYCGTKDEPLIVFSKNGKRRYAAIDFNLFLTMLESYYETHGYPLPPLVDDRSAPGELVSATRKRREENEDDDGE